MTSGRRLRLVTIEETSGIQLEEVFPNYLRHKIVKAVEIEPAYGADTCCDGLTCCPMLLSPIQSNARRNQLSVGAGCMSSRKIVSELAARCDSCLRFCCGKLTVFCQPPSINHKVSFSVLRRSLFPLYPSKRPQSRCLSKLESGCDSSDLELTT